MRRRSVELHGDIGSVQTQLLATSKELSRVKSEKEKVCKENKTYLMEAHKFQRENAEQAEQLVKLKEQLQNMSDKHKVRFIGWLSAIEAIEHCGNNFIFRTV